MTSTDLVAVIEAAYGAGCVGDDQWLAEVLEACRRHVDDGLGVFGYLYHLEGEGVAIGDVAGAGASEALLGAVRQVAAFSAGMRGLHARPRPEMVSVSQLLGKEWATQGRTAFSAFGSPFGVRDTVALAVRDVDGKGLVLAAPRRRVSRVAKSERQKWTLVAAHLVTALRLQAIDQMDDRTRVDAVLQPGGRLLHAEGDAIGHRESLRLAAQAIDRARSSLRRKSPEQALSLWKALVDGEWSLLDHFESDGRRYVVARRNGPRPRGAREPLSRRELAVLALACQGHSHKWVGYSLGLSVPSVSKILNEAARKLGAANRMELLRLGGAIFDPTVAAESPGLT